MSGSLRGRLLAVLLAVVAPVVAGLCVLLYLAVARAVWAAFDDDLHDLAGTLAAKVNDPAWVLVEVAGKARVVVGKIVEVAPVADPASRTRRVRVEVPNASGASQIVAGEPAWVRFTEPTKGAMDKLGAQASAAGTGGGPAR